MIPFLLAEAVFTANQGSAVRLKLPDEPRVKSVHVIWLEKTVPAFRVDGSWMTIVGIGLDAKPGAQPAEAFLTMDDGQVERRELTVDIVAKTFPTSQVHVAERFVELNKADLARAGRESRETEAIYGRITTSIVPDEPFTVPIPRVTGTNFGERRVFNGEPRAPHAGADLHAAAGMPVHATNRGRVVLAKKLFFTGNTVILDHGLGIYSLYAHLSRIDVRPGTTVKNGRIVGLVGATGRVTAPHLHWGMRVQGARVDPFSLVGAPVAFRRSGIHIDGKSINWEDRMATKRTTSTRKPKAQAGVIYIELTPEQRAHIKRESKGKLDISTLRLRPDLNLRLQELTTVLGRGARIRQEILNGAGGQWWA